MSERVQPKGVEVTITDRTQVILSFDREDVPDIVFTADGAEQIGSTMVSASNRSRRGIGL